MTLRIAIFGIGAMGCLFGARLSPLADVTLFGTWPEQIAALGAGPLRVIYPDGHEEPVALRAMPTADALRQTALRGAFEVALVLTKSSRTRLAGQSAAWLLRPDGLAVTLQNGLGNYEILTWHVGPGRAALGVTTQGAATDGPGVLRVGGTGTTHLTGCGAVTELAGLLNRAGLETHCVDDVSGLLWGKLAINAAINPLTALLRVPNGALLESAQARAIMGAAAREVAAVAAAQNIALAFPDPAATAEAVARLTAPNRSSMLQDVERGAPTEIDAICGAVVREGARLGVETPVNALLDSLVRALDELAALRAAAGAGSQPAG